MNTVLGVLVEMGWNTFVGRFMIVVNTSHKAIPIAKEKTHAHIPINPMDSMPRFSYECGPQVAVLLSFLRSGESRGTSRHGLLIGGPIALPGELSEPGSPVPLGRPP